MSLPLGGRRRAEGLGVLWARRKIESLLDSLHEGAPADEVRAAVVALGLEHHLVTKHTSLVAVDVTPVASGGRSTREAARRDEPAPRLARTRSVFGELPRTATPLRLHALVGVLALLARGGCWGWPAAGAGRRGGGRDDSSGRAARRRPSVWRSRWRRGAAATRRGSRPRRGWPSTWCAARGSRPGRGRGRASLALGRHPPGRPPPRPRPGRRPRSSWPGRAAGRWPSAPAT